MKYLGLGFLIPCAIVAGYFLGTWLDELFHTHFLYLVLLIVGAAGGLYGMIRDVQSQTTKK